MTGGKGHARSTAKFIACRTEMYGDRDRVVAKAMTVLYEDPSVKAKICVGERGPFLPTKAYIH
jgi:hypothetical protein